MRSIFGTAAIAALLLSAACGDDQDPTPIPTPSPTSPVAGSESTPTGSADASAGGTYDADIKFLIHEDVEVPVGTTVVWTSVQGYKGPSLTFHTVTSGKPGDPDEGSLFDSGEVAEYASFSHTFNEAGEFPFFCRIHPFFMKGVVEVQ